MFLVVALAQRLDKVVGLLFDLGGDSSTQGTTMRRDPSTPDSTRQVSDSYRVMKSTRDFQQDMWLSLVDAEASALASWTEFATLFWPSTKPLEECYFYVCFAVCTVLTEIEWRFGWDYTTWPHKLIPLEVLHGSAESINFRWERAAFGIASSCEYC